ncbi:MAG: alpha/beta hydrolase [Planctomycetota bacterium]
MRARSLMAVVIAAAALTACQRQLMPTPNIYVDGRYELFDELPPSLQTSTVDVLYVTDREPMERPDGSLRYGYGRSASVAFGSTTVEIGSDLDWDILLANSTTARRSGAMPVRVRSITELGRFAPTPLPVVRLDGAFVRDPEVVAEQDATLEIFAAALRRRLAVSSSRSATVYVHGFKNSFDDAAKLVAEFWHFAGRRGVAILYSWPAGSPGLLKGYAQDRESGQFTVYHLKQFLRALATVDELDQVNLVAHSRGTEVLSAALRELLIEDRQHGKTLNETRKIRNGGLASPDLYIEVVAQRYHRLCLAEGHSHRALRGVQPQQTAARASGCRGHQASAPAEARGCRQGRHRRGPREGRRVRSQLLPRQPRRQLRPAAADSLWSGARLARAAAAGDHPQLLAPRRRGVSVRRGTAPDRPRVSLLVICVAGGWVSSRPSPGWIPRCRGSPMAAAALPLWSRMDAAECRLNQGDRLVKRGEPNRSRTDEGETR